MGVEAVREQSLRHIQKERLQLPPNAKRCHRISGISCHNLQPTNQTMNLTMNSLSLHQLGREHYQHGRYEPARQHLQQALETGPDHPALRRDLGNACFQVQDYSAALEHLQVARQAESLNPLQKAQLLEEIARVHVAQDDCHAAKPLYNEALDCKRSYYGKLQGSSSPSSSDNLKQQHYGYDQAVHVEIAYTLHHLGRIGHALGQRHKARNKYAEALQMYQVLGSPTDASEVAKDLKQLAEDMNKPDWVQHYQSLIRS